MYRLEGKVQHSKRSWVRSAALLAVIIGVLVWLRLAGAGFSQTNNNNAVACDDQVFLTQNSSETDGTSEMRITEASDPQTFFVISPTLGRELNAIGLSAQQGKFYAIVPTTGRVWGLGYDGTTYTNPSNGVTYKRPKSLDNLGIPDALQKNIPPYSPEVTARGHSGYYAGDVRNRFLPAVDGNAANGRLYTYNLDNSATGSASNGTTHKLFAIDIENPANFQSVAVIPMTGSMSTDLRMNDWAFNPNNGLLYGYDENRNKILSVNPVSGKVVDRSLVNLAGYPLNGSKKMGTPGVNQAHGAAWFDAEGNFWTYRNGGAIFKVPLNGGFVDVNGIEERSAQGSFTNDGAACPAIGFTKSVSPDPVVEGATVTYTYRIKNISSTQTLLANFIDDMSGYSDGRTFITEPGSPSFSGFVNNAPPGLQYSITNNNKTFSTSGQTLKVPPNGTGTITIKVQTKVNFIFNPTVLHNDSLLKDIQLGGLQNAADRHASADLNVNPIPGAKPYLKVYGNDVAAGSSFDNGETCVLSNTEAKIITVAGQSNANWVGAGSQLASFATGTIDAYISAAMHNGAGGDAIPSVGLTFGNTSGGWGGKFGALRCIPDYFNLVKNNGGAQIPGGNQGVRTVSAGEHAAVYFDGDVTISGNIAYGSTGGWADLNSIPSFFLVARGNIYIRNNVDTLDGTYVAMPRFDTNGNIVNSTGNIYTCTLPGANNPTGASQCNIPLTIHGAFIARKVYFQRTKGDAVNSLNNEGPNSNPATNNIAETFDFSQETYLSPLNGSLRSSSPYSKYDSIVSLPPIL